MFETLPPSQRQALMIGIPVVAVFALVNVIRGRTTATEPGPAAPGDTGPSVTPTGDAVGTDALTGYADSITGALQSLQETLTSRTLDVTPPAPAEPAPAPPLSDAFQAMYQNAIAIQAAKDLADSKAAAAAALAMVAPKPAAPAPAPKPAAPAPAPAPAPAQRVYVVVPGDSLWAIATRFYGNGGAWPTIYNANTGVIGANPNLIYPGQRLVIP